ncbi:MAG: glycoside hydrolase family 125 protein, partial [Oscillospiraceae bacterium]
KGLIDVRGGEQIPFLVPFVNLNGERLKFENLKWHRKNYWIPKFTTTCNDIKLDGVILSPINETNERGFIYKIDITNLSNKRQNMSTGFLGSWCETYHCINEEEKINATKNVSQSNWNQSIVFSLKSATNMFSFAPMFSTIVKTDYKTLSNGDITYNFSKDITLCANETYSLTFYLGVGFETVSAATSAKEMLRKGYKTEYEATCNWLGERIKTTGNIILDKLMNENLFFSYFFGSGVTLDTEEFCLVTSTSPRYYVSAAYWDRDSLLWSFPAILITDSSYAKEMLTYVFTKQSKNIGIHSRYIDGTVLEPGFELDELCAPVIALSKYIQTTKDYDFLKEDFIIKALKKILQTIKNKKHPKYDLYETFLQPTDDEVVYKYITYNNALVWKMFSDIATMYNALGVFDDQTILNLKQQAENVKNSIYSLCVKNVDGDENKKIFAWSVDLDSPQGSWDLYDEPPGSMQLMAYYGFCDFNDPIYMQTVEVIRRKEYPYSFADCYIADIGCPHAPHPWILSIANSLLCGNKEHGKLMCERIIMDNGIACESVDEHTGQCKTGEAFATCAGFISYAIYHAFGRKD